MSEGIATMADKPVLHGDNGSTLKATTVLSMPNPERDAVIQTAVMTHDKQPLDV